MIKAILFDFDGTLADTIPAITEGVNITMHHYGYPEHSEAAVRTFINQGARHLIRSAMPRALQSNESLVDEVFEHYSESYRLVHLNTKETYAGMRELVSRIHGIARVGVLSNKQDPHLRSLVEQVLEPGSFDGVQGVIQGHPAKPDPYLANRLTAALGVKPEECALVGDSDIDILTAKNAGMLHIGVTWGYKSAEVLREKGATLLANSVEELEALLRERIGG